jgi:hypothetical protein
MLRHLLATTGILIALGAPAFAEEPAAGATDQTTTTGTTAQTDAQTDAQGTVRPDPEGATGSTPAGGITPPAKEIIPDTPSEDEAAIEPQDLDATGAPEMGQATQSGAAGSGVVSREVVQELRQMALEAEKKAAKPPETQTEEEIAAEREAIERHRAGLFGRVDERS